MAIGNQTMTSSGTFASRPSADPKYLNRLYWASDQKKLFQDKGTTWIELLVSDGPGGSPTMRTIGSGSQQAAAADHTH